MSSQIKQIGMRTLMGWGILGQLVYVISQFVALLAMTRFARVEDVGIYGLASAIVIPVFFFFDLSMRVNVAASARSAYSFQDFRGLLLASLTVGMVIIAIIGVTSFTGNALIILLILGATKFAESISEFSYGVFQRFDRMSLVAGSQILRSVGGTIFFVLFLINGVSVEVAFLAQLIVWSAVAVGLDHRRARQLWRDHAAINGLEPARMLDLARNSIWLALSGLLSALQGNAPRYAIVWLLDVVALGHFTVVGYAMQAISTVAMAVTQSLVSRFNSFIEDGRRHALWQTLRKLMGGLAVFAALGVAVSLLIGDWLVQAIFGADYRDLGNLLAICVLAASLGAVVLILQTCILAGRRFKLNLLIRVGTALAMLLCCLGGGMALGLPGIALGICAAFLFHIVALSLAMKTLWRTGHS